MSNHEDWRDRFEGTEPCDHPGCLAVASSAPYRGSYSVQEAISTLKAWGTPNPDTEGRSTRPNIENVLDEGQLIVWLRELEHHRETLRRLVVPDSAGQPYLLTDLAIEEELQEREPWLWDSEG